MPFGARKNIGLMLGIVILVIGAVGVLGKIGIFSFNVSLPLNIMAWILAGGGLYLIIESATEIGSRRTIAMLVALVVLLLTLIPILNQLGIIAFSIPGLSLIVYHVLLVVEGFFLVVNAFGT